VIVFVDQGGQGPSTLMVGAPGLDSPGYHRHDRSRERLTVHLSRSCLAKVGHQEEGVGLADLQARTISEPIGASGAIAHGRLVEKSSFEPMMIGTVSGSAPQF
jgi:hypothetical protein